MYCWNKDSSFRYHRRDVGPLWKGKYGPSKGRWHFWTKRFGELSSSDEPTEELRGVAKEAEVTMAKIEAHAVKEEAMGTIETDALSEEITITVEDHASTEKTERPKVGFGVWLRQLFRKRKVNHSASDEKGQV